MLIAIHPTTYRGGGFLAHGVLKAILEGLKVYGLQPQTDKYDTKKPSIEHTMDYLVEYLADEYAADIAQEKYSSENSPLSELGEEKYKMDEYRRNVRFFSGTALTG